MSRTDRRESEAIVLRSPSPVIMESRMRTPVIMEWPEGRALSVTSRGRIIRLSWSEPVS